MPGKKSPTSPKRALPVPNELAHRLVLAVRDGNLAGAFIENYAKQYNRREFTVHADRARELQIIVEREILLAAAAQVAVYAEESAAQRRARSGARSGMGDAGRFVRELISAIGTEMRWTAGDVIDFRGDFTLYREIMLSRSAKSAGIPRSFRRTGASGPFVDRCAFLLDPSMMENARQAAAKLAQQIEALALGNFDALMNRDSRGH